MSIVRYMYIDRFDKIYWVVDYEGEKCFLMCLCILKVFRFLVELKVYGDWMYIVD